MARAIAFLHFCKEAHGYAELGSWKYVSPTRIRCWDPKTRTPQDPHGPLNLRSGKTVSFKGFRAKYMVFFTGENEIVMKPKDVLKYPALLNLLGDITQVLGVTKTSLFEVRFKLTGSTVFYLNYDLVRQLQPSLVQQFKVLVHTSLVKLIFTKCLCTFSYTLRAHIGTKCTLEMCTSTKCTSRHIT
jgi:hypothetical protein